MAIVTFFVIVAFLVANGVLCALVLKQHRAVREAAEQIREVVQRQDALAARIDALPGEEAVEELVKRFALEYKGSLTNQIETSVAAARKDVESLVERKLEAQRLEFRETVTDVERRIEGIQQAIPEQVAAEAGRVVRLIDTVRAVTRKATKRLRGKKRAEDPGDEELSEDLSPSPV